MSPERQIEKQLYAARHAQLLECLEEVILYGMLAQVQLAGNCLVSFAPCRDLNHLFLPGGKSQRFVSHQCAGGRNAPECFQKGICCFFSRPNRSFAYMLDAIDEFA